MSPAQVVVAVIVVVVGAAIQGSVGFGFALVAAPVLALIDRALVPGPLVFCGLVLAVLLAVRERASLDLGALRWALAGRIPGTVAGAVAVAVVPDRQLGIAIGLTILLAVAVSVTGWRPMRTPAQLFTAGAVSGVMGVTASVGGPPMALLYQRAEANELRAAMAGFALVGAMLSLGGLILAGAFGPADLVRGAALSVPMAVGMVASGFLSGRLQGEATRYTVLAVAALSAVVLVATELV